MKNRKIDEEIRQALSEEDVVEYDKFADEQSLLAQALELWKGKNRWLNIGVMIVTFAFMIVAIVCAWNFHQAEDIKELLGWSLGLAFSFAVVGMLKLWAWMEMEKNSTIREIKRLELQVARLSRRLED